jgi:hypothetical protein
VLFVTSAGAGHPEKLKLALRLRLRRGPVVEAAAEQIAAALDAAAQSVERS